MTKLLLVAFVFAVFPLIASAGSNLGDFNAELEQRGFGPIKKAIEERKALEAKRAEAVAKGGPCAVASSFIGTTYELSMPPQTGRPTKFSFVYKGCSPYFAEEAPHGRLSEDEAITTFTDEKAGYNLVVVTPAGHGSGRTTITLVQDVRTTSLGDVSTEQLLTKGLALSLGWGAVLIRK